MHINFKVTNLALYRYSHMTSLYTLYSTDYTANTLGKLSPDAEESRREGVRLEEQWLYYVFKWGAWYVTPGTLTSTRKPFYWSCWHSRTKLLSTCLCAYPSARKYLCTRILTHTRVSYFHKRNVNSWGTPFTTLQPPVTTACFHALP